MIDAVLGKFYKYIILGLMILIFGYVFYANSLAGKLANAEKVKTKAVADAIKPYQDAIDQAQEEKATIMKTWSAKIIEVEQNAIKQIQAANSDARNAQFSADSMSKQLSEANKRLSSAPKQTIITTPLPTQNYSKVAQQNIEVWQKKLMDTSLMSGD